MRKHLHLVINRSVVPGEGIWSAKKRMIPRPQLLPARYPINPYRGGSGREMADVTGHATHGGWRRKG